MGMVKNKKLSRFLVAILALATVLAFSMPATLAPVNAADPGGSSEGTVGYYHPTQGDVKYVFPAGQVDNIPDPHAGWLGGVEPQPNKQYVYCINPSRNALDNKNWNQHFRWRYNLNVNRWILSNNNDQLQNPVAGFDADDMYAKLQKTLYLGYPYNYGDAEYSYADTQHAVQYFIVGNNWELGRWTQEAENLVNEVNGFTGDISGGLYFYAPDTDTKQIAQNTVGLAVWNEPNTPPEEVTPPPEEPEPSPATATVGVSAKKAVSGDDWKNPSEWSNKQFAFKLEGAGKAEAMLEVSEALADQGRKFVHTRWLGQDKMTDANGLNPKHDEVFFGEISFREEGTYKFKVYELDPNITDENQPNAAVDGQGRALGDYEAVDGMTYDHAMFDLEFVVTKVGNSLKVKQSGRDVTGTTVSVDKSGKEIKFTNEYDEPGALKTTVTAKGETGAENSPATIKVPAAGETMDVTDKIDYEGLTAGATYIVEGTLMNVTDNKEVATAKEELKAAAASGSWTVTFKNVKLEAGKKYVVFEKAVNKADDKDFAEHKNPDDTKQTIVVEEETTPTPPSRSLKTTVQVGDKVGTADKEVTLTADEAAETTSIVDIIEYEGLTAGATYKVTGTLMNVTDNKAVKTVEIEKKAEAAKGKWEVSFADISIEAGKKYVVFEEAVNVADDKDKAEHKDVNDKAQTIIVEPEEYTSELKATKTTDVKTASVGDVIPYTITITNEGNGDAKDVAVKDVIGKYLKYVSDDSNGNHVGQNVNWTVNVPANETVEISIDCEVVEGAQGKLINKVLIIDSTNPNDIQEYEDNAAVAFAPPENDDNGNGDDSNKKAATGTNQTTKMLARTGDDFNLGLWATLLAISALGLAAGAFRKRFER